MLKILTNGNSNLAKVRRGLIFLLLCLFVSKCTAKVPQCCSNNSSWMNHSRNCTDGTKVQLKCTQFYLFQPSVDIDEKYRIVEENNNTWIVFENLNDGATYNTSAEQFCMTKQNQEEIALICFPDGTTAIIPPSWKTIFFGIFSMLSSVFLAFTLLVYLVLPEMRDVQDKAIISMTASFMVAFFINANQNLNAPVDQNVCVLMAFMMYYAYLCAFFWLNIISFNIWRSVWLPSFKPSPNILNIIYCAVGWGIPLCFLATSLVNQHIDTFFLKPGFGEVSCWFKGNTAHWVYFYGPILTLISLNIVYLALTGWKLWMVYNGLNCSNLKVLRFKCWMFVKLSLLMGFTWIFEILSFASGRAAEDYWLVTDVLNVMQGFFIFILLVVSRKRIRKLLAKKRPFNIPFPKAWAAYADEENSQHIGPEELELSQP